MQPNSFAVSQKAEIQTSMVLKIYLRRKRFFNWKPSDCILSERWQVSSTPRGFIFFFSWNSFSFAKSIALLIDLKDLI